MTIIMFEKKLNCTKEIKSKKRQQEQHTRHLDAVRKKEVRPKKTNTNEVKLLEDFLAWLLRQDSIPTPLKIFLFFTIASMLCGLPTAAAQTAPSSNLTNTTNTTTAQIYAANLNYQPTTILLDTFQRTIAFDQKTQPKSKKKKPKAVKNKNNIELLEKLINEGTTMPQTDDNHFILFQAIGEKDIKKLHLLKKLGWNFNKIKPVTGKAPIHPFTLACSEGNLNVIETLIEFGIDIYCGNPLGKLMPLTALISGFALGKNSNERLDILEKLISQGLDVDPQGKNQNKVEMLLFQAKKLGWTELSVFLNNYYNNKNTPSKTKSNSFFDSLNIFSFFSQTEIPYKKNEENNNEDKEKTENQYNLK